MALVPGAPVGFNPNAAYPQAVGTVTPSPYVTTPLSPEQTAEADLFFAELETEAAYEGWKYMCVRVPSHLQEYFLESHPNPQNPELPPAEEPPALDSQTERQRQGRMARGDSPPALANPARPDLDPNLNPNVQYDPRVRQ